MDDSQSAESPEERRGLPSAPTLEAQDARIVVGDTTVMTGLSLQTRGDRVLLVGSAEALVAAIIGVPGRPRGDGPDPPARVVDGSLRVGGAEVATGEHVARCGVAPLEPLVPPGWSVQEYLGWGARLGGVSKGETKALAHRALERLGLGALRRRRLRTLDRLERRGVTLALAIVRDPLVIVVDDPLASLDDDEVTAALTVMAAAAEGRAAIIAVPQLTAPSPAAHLARTATDVCLFRGGELVLTAEPARLFGAATIYEVTVKEGGEALRRALAERGLDLRGGPEHFSVSLPGDRGTSDVLAAAAEARAAVTSCVPLL
ncbi:MAG: ABC transporter ATP-binding protein [Deltaproteobacteria bacterium]|nr:ABC transporter ATP-binding protein [Deltaproteobacteria bacterium]